MKSSTASKLALYFTENAVLSAILTMLVLIMGVLMHSSPLVVASGILAFGRPFLYGAQLNAQHKARNSVAIELDRRASFERRSSNRTAAFGTR